MVLLHDLVGPPFPDAIRAARDSCDGRRRHKDRDDQAGGRRGCALNCSTRGLYADAICTQPGAAGRELALHLVLPDPRPVRAELQVGPLTVELERHGNPCSRRPAFGCAKAAAVLCRRATRQRRCGLQMATRRYRRRSATHCPRPSSASIAVARLADPTARVPPAAARRQWPAGTRMHGTARRRFGARRRATDHKPRRGPGGRPGRTAKLRRAAVRTAAAALGTRGRVVGEEAVPARPAPGRWSERGNAGRLSVQRIQRRPPGSRQRAPASRCGAG